MRDEDQKLEYMRRWSRARNRALAALRENHEQEYEAHFDYHKKQEGL